MPRYLNFVFVLTFVIAAASLAGKSPIKDTYEVFFETDKLGNLELGLELFSQRDSELINVKEARKYLLKAIKEESGDRLVEAVEKYAHLAFYEGALVTPEDDLDTRNEIFSKCRRAVEAISPERLGEKVPAYYYWKVTCFALWAQTVDNLEVWRPNKYKPMLEYSEFCRQKGFHEAEAYWHAYTQKFCQLLRYGARVIGLDEVETHPYNQIIEFKQTLAAGFRLKASQKYAGGGIFRVAAAAYVADETWKMLGLYDVAKAFKLARIAIKFGPEQAGAYLIQAKILRKMGKDSEAKEVLEILIADLEKKIASGKLDPVTAPDDELILGIAQQMLAGINIKIISKLSPGPKASLFF